MKYSKKIFVVLAAVSKGITVFSDATACNFLKMDAAGFLANLGMYLPNCTQRMHLNLELEECHIHGHEKDFCRH
jgi:hypothetical protein